MIIETDSTLALLSATASNCTSVHGHLHGLVQLSAVNISKNQVFLKKVALFNARSLDPPIKGLPCSQRDEIMTAPPSNRVGSPGSHRILSLSPMKTKQRLLEEKIKISFEKAGGSREESYKRKLLVQLLRRRLNEIIVCGAVSVLRNLKNDMLRGIIVQRLPDEASKTNLVQFDDLSQSALIYSKVWNIPVLSASSDDMCLFSEVLGLKRCSMIGLRSATEESKDVLNGEERDAAEGLFECIKTNSSLVLIKSDKSQANLNILRKKLKKRVYQKRRRARRL
eukprot:Filipodium_phascolosomae@DN6924_c0_g1_i1.p1